MIETARLKLIPCDLHHFEAILHDEQRLAELLQVKLADEWLGFPAAREALQPSLEHLKKNQDILGWWTYLFVYKPDQMLIGLGGFKGLVTEDGVVELGYEIAPAYRRSGLATEAAQGMMDYAFANAKVRRVEAHTLPERNASTRVLERVGMKFVEAVQDPQDGEVWRWRISREQYEARKKNDPRK